MTKSSRRRRRVRWVAYSTLLVLALLAGTGYDLTRPQRLASFASRVLRGMYPGTEPTIESARFNLRGEIELRGLRLDIAGLPPGAGEIFRADRALLHVDPRSLLTGDPQLLRVIVIHPVLSITEVAPDRFNVDVLRELTRSKRAIDQTLPKLPQVTVQDGAVRYGEALEGEYRQVGVLSLAGRLDPDTREPSLYHFQLAEQPASQRPADALPGARLTGRFDLKDLSVQAELSDLVLAHPHRNMLPRQVRAWWDKLELAGAVSGVRFSYSDEDGPKAQVSVKGVELTLPQLSTPDYRVRMTDVAGTFRFEGERMEVQGLVGQIEGLEYRIDGQIRGYSAQAPLNLILRTQPFQIPREPRYMLALPTQVQRLFRMFAPSGWASASVTARRERPGGRLEYGGTIQVLSGREVFEALRAAGQDTGGLTPSSPELVSRGRYSGFPYEMTNVRGLITFDDDSVELRQVSADSPGGGRVTTSGRIDPAQGHVDVDLTISAVGIPIDQALLEAMNASERAATMLFFDKGAWERLRSRGLLDAPDGSGPDFELGGRVNAVARVTGSAGGGSKPQVAVTVDVVDVRSVFEKFPYPARVTGGKLKVTRDKVEVQDVRFEGIHGGGGSASGTIIVAPGKSIIPQLSIKARGFPIDGLLLEALGPRRSRPLALLHVEGRLDAEGTIFCDPQGRIDTDLQVTLTNGLAAAGDYTLQDLRGKLNVGLRKVQIKRLTAVHDHSSIELGGDIREGDGDRPDFQIRMAGTALRFEDPLLGFMAALEGLPERARSLMDLWAKRKPTGVFDADVELKSSGDYKVTLRPDSLAFDRERGRVNLTQINGSLVVEPEGVRAEVFSADFGGGRLGIDGPIWPETRASVQLAGDTASKELPRLLPPEVTGVIGALELDGHYEFIAPQLRLSHTVPGGMEFNGTVKFTGASCNIGVPVQALDGVLDIACGPGGGAPPLKLLLRADRLRVADRPIEHLSVALRSVGGGALRIEELRGACAGGRIAGQGLVSLQDGAVQARLALADADLGQLSHGAPGDSNPAPAKSASNAGRLSASLDLEGSWRKRGKLRGRGSIAVRGAHLKSIPLALGLLRVSHLMLPVGKQFDTANVAYYLMGDRINFESIELSSESMRLTGQGVMTLPGQKLDIALTTSNPRGLDLGPVTRIINKFRDQLVTVRITGTLDRPITKVQQLYGVAGAVGDVLGKESQGKSKP